MTLITKTNTALRTVVCIILTLASSLTYGQDNPSLIDFQVRSGGTYTFEIASTSTPNFQLVSDLTSWGNVRRHEDTDGDNIYQIDFTAPEDYLGNIEFVFSYTGVNPFPFYTYTRRIIVKVKVVSSMIDPKDDVVIYQQEDPLIIKPLDNDDSDFSLKLHSIAGSSYGTAEVLNDLEIAFSPGTDFNGNSIITYVVEDSTGNKAKSNIYIISESDGEGDQEIDLLVSSENGAFIFLPNGNYALSSHSRGKGTLNKVASQVYFFQPDAGKLGNDQVVFEHEKGDLYTVNIDIIDNSPDLDGVKDDKFYTAVDQEVVFNVALNDYYDPSNISWFSSELTEVSPGIYKYLPPSGFNGFKKFYYKVNTGSNILTGEILLKVDNYLPNPRLYEFKVPKNQALVLEYDVPIEGISFQELGAPKIGSLEIFLEEANVEIECGTLSSIPKIVYTPKTHFLGFDEFEIEYCTAEGSCQVLKTKISVYDDEVQDGCGCVNDCVYPGDINADGVVQASDLLHIGLHMGEAGMARQERGIAWKSYRADNWSAETASGVNLKHVDADGDGIVTDQDVRAIVDNIDKYSTYIPSSIDQLRKSPIILVPRSTEVEPGDVFLIDVFLGDDRNPVLDMHGLAFSLNLNPETFDISNTAFVSARNSWLMEGFGSLEVLQNKETGKLNIALSRTSGLPKSGRGKIGTLQTIVVDEIEGFRIGDPHDDRPIDKDPGLDIVIDIDDVKAVDSKGSFYTIPAVGSEIKLKRQHDRQRTLAEKTLAFPNPTVDHLNIYVNGERSIEYIRMYDLMGRKIHEVNNLNGNQYQLSTSSMNGGIYLLEVSDGTEVVTKKIKVLD